jgi:integrase
MPRYTFKRESEINEAEARLMINQAVAKSKFGLAALVAFLYLYGCRIGEAVGKPPYDDYPGMRIIDFDINEKELIAKIAIEKKRLYSYVCKQCGTARQSNNGIEKHFVKMGHQGSELRKKSSVYSGNFSKLALSRGAPFVEDVLMPYLGNFSGDGRLFPYSREYAWEMLKDLNPKVSPHIFRHGRITQIIGSTGSVAKAKAWARHSSINTTMSYAHESELLEGVGAAIR